MKVSLNFIKKFTPVNLSVEDLITKIGMQLGAVEEVIDNRGKYNGVKIVQITEAKPHPNADKLNIYQMTDGQEQVQVVSGDRNLEVGDKVAWIAPGLTVPSTYHSEQPVVMEARPLRGELSQGMFGSGKELEINDDHEGVLKLDTDAKPGTLLQDAYDLNDVIIDIENKMFTHRPDCFGLLGVAREVAGIQGLAFKSPEWYLLETGKLLKAETEELPLEVSNEIPALCPEYQAAVMSGISVGSSPLWLQSYLKRHSIRPINSVVDVTNYLMHLTGQPLHAFDYHKVAGLDNQKHAGIVVRAPKKREQLILLDGKVIEPHQDAVLICSRHHPLALGGVMGGSATEVDGQTTAIIIESANFNLYAIRKTAMEHGIFTDAVTRFGKGQSREQCGVVLAEAVRLMGQHAGGQLAGELGIAKPLAPPAVVTDVEFLNQRLGSDLDEAKIKQLLESVEMEVAAKDWQLRVRPPFWRTDIELPEDLVEEVGRLHGYNSLPHELPGRSTEAVELPGLELFKTEIRTLLADAGNNELQTYSFVSSKLFTKTSQETQPAYRLRNALSPELEFMRTSLLPSLLEKVHPNHKAGFEQFGLFEIGKSHNKYEIGEDDLPRDRLGLSYVFSVEAKAAKTWGGAPFYQARQQLACLLDDLHVPRYSLAPLSEATLELWWLQNIARLFEPRRAAVLTIAEKPLGIVGELTAAVRRRFKLPDFVSGFELDLGLLHAADRPVSIYRPLLKYPSTDQDICFRVPTEVTYAELKTLVAHHFTADQRLRVTIAPLDIYQRDRDPGHKQITFRLSLQHHDRTLTTEEVNQFLADLAAEAHKQLGARRV